MSLQNLFGDLALDETMQKIAVFLEQIAGNLNRTYPDPNGSIRAAITTGTLTTVSTVSNEAAVGGFNAQYDQYCQMMVAANTIRSQIITS